MIRMVKSIIPSLADMAHRDFATFITDLRNPGSANSPRMTLATRIPFSALSGEAAVAGPAEKAASRLGLSPRLRLPLAAGFIAGAGLALGLAEIERGAGEPAAAPANPAAPQMPVNERPYVPPIRIGSWSGASNSGALAPSLGSAALRRVGEAS